MQAQEFNLKICNDGIFVLNKTIISYEQFPPLNTHDIIYVLLCFQTSAALDSKYFISINMTAGMNKYGNNHTLFHLSINFKEKINKMRDII
jgi:hypothetical protein